MISYFIAIIPPKDIHEKILKIKQEVKERFGASHALKLPAHITLQPPFRTEEKKEKLIIEVLQEYTKNLDALKIRLSGFGAFPPRVIFIKISDHDPIITLCEELQVRVNDRIGLKERERSGKIHPHITIASRDLDPTSFGKAWAEMKSESFTASFIAESLFLLKHNGKRWDILREFRFRA